MAEQIALPPTPFVASVAAEASRNRQEFDSLVSDQQRIEVRLATLRERQRGLNQVLSTYGQAEIALNEPGSLTFANPGNRSKATPPRRERWESVSLTVATKTIMNEQPTRVFDINAVLDELYDIVNDDQRRAAKRSLRSTLARGVTDGSWDSPKPGQYHSTMRNSQVPLAGAVVG